jgi:L-ribulokinase
MNRAAEASVQSALPRSSAQEVIRKYALGLDFGTESVRALVVDCERGVETAQAVQPYAHGVITSSLPGSSVPLPPEFALQNAQDYLDAAISAIQRVLKTVPAISISGVGVDFTACTILPITKDGTPLMFKDEFRANPHAWVKLWKHHAAQIEADKVNELARDRGEGFLKYYSGTISSEWMLPKCWEIASRAPEIYEAADLFIDAGDWFVQQMTGQFTRNSCAAGYKGLWNAELGFPSKDFLGALDPAIRDLDDKWLKNIVAPGSWAGGVSKKFAALAGLIEGTPVSAATIDAHSGVAGMGVYREGAMSIIMGTSSCHMALSRELKHFQGYAGVVKDGIIPGFYGYESGQAAVGDIFGWYARDFLTPGARALTSIENDPFGELSRKAAALAPGASGLVALDWMNGNRSVLMNSHLSGMLLGLTLTTRPEEVYRALVEATAFGTRVIIEAHQKAGIPITELVVCGGLTQDPFIMQTYADVTGLPVKVAASNQAVALGAAIFGAMAAGKDEGGFAHLEDAIVRMTAPARRSFIPDLDTQGAYEALYSVYLNALDHFGRQQPGIMKSLKELKAKALMKTQTTVAPQSGEEL